MQIGVPKETAEGEKRVALVPEIIKKMASGPGEDDAEPVEIVVEQGARCASDAAGDLSPVGDQDLAEQLHASWQGARSILQEKSRGAR